MEEQADQATRIQIIPLDKISEPVKPMRSSISAEALAELTESIRAEGVIQPLILMPSGDGFEIVAGHRRFLASKAAGLAVVPAIIKPFDAIEMLRIRFAENFAREDCDPMAQALFIQEFMASTNLPSDRVQETLGVSAYFINSRLALFDLPDDLKSALAEKQIGINAALELSKVKDDATRLALLQNAIENGATLRTINIWVLDHLRMLGYKVNIPGVEGLNVGINTEAAILKDHPVCDLLGCSLHGVRRVMMIICGDCHQQIVSERITRKAADTIAAGSESLNTKAL